VTITDPETQGWTTIEGSSGTGLSYGPQSNDGIRTVQTIASNGVAPAVNLIVTFTVTKGKASLACGQVVDALGNLLAGATVNFYETLRPWTPPCPPSGSCPTAPVLATQTVQATSDANGMVTLKPLIDGTIPT